MTQVEFNELSNNLASISNQIPVRWGAVQNDKADSKINMFNHKTFESLQNALRDETAATKDYFNKRWFVWQCAQCDEFLFYAHYDITPNPNPYDQEWDIEFFGRQDWRFDIKGTVVPVQFRQGNSIPTDSLSIIEFNYEKQSRGVRNNFQNRLFIVHIPLNTATENPLRANFNAKQIVFNAYIEMLRQNPNYVFFDYRGVKSDLVYIVEGQRGQISHYFASTVLNNNH